MKSWLYARVSTARNSCRQCNKLFLSAETAPVCPVCSSTDIEKSQDTENQLRVLRRWVTELGHEVAAEYVDRASGKSAERERFKQMYIDLAARRPRTPVLVVFWSLDRFSREGVVETLQHLRKLGDLGAEWRSYTEQYLDSTGIFKDAIIAIFAALAKQQRIRISENTKAGLDRARTTGTRSGKAIGRPQILNKAQVAESFAITKSLRATARVFRVSHVAIKYCLEGRPEDQKKIPKKSWSEPVWGVVNGGVFVEHETEGEVVVRYDMDTGLPWCLNHRDLLSKCVASHEHKATEVFDEE